MIAGLSLVILLGSLVLPFSSQAATQVVVVVGQGAPDLEHIAAQEVVAQFKRLFDVNVLLTDFMPEKHEHLVLVGGPQKNKAVRDVMGDRWPQLSEQGFLLQSFDRDGRRGVVVGGSSPAATLWAVYELGHRFGIRYLLREDIYPDQQPLKLDGFDVVQEPALKVRAWRTIDDLPLGPSSWALADHKLLLRQLAKLKFNHLLLSLHPWQPFEQYEFGGVRKQTTVLWKGARYKIPADSPGRTAVGEVAEFVNADFAGKSTPEEMTAAGIRHARGVISQAKRLGMSVGISLSPLEFPREFAQALPGLESQPGTNDLLVAPGPRLQPDDATLKQLVSVRLRACLETYPQVDVLYLTLADLPGWAAHAESVWPALAEQSGGNGRQLVDLIASARKHTSGNADRGERSLRSDMVSLAFLGDLLSDPKLTERSDGSKVQVALADVDPALSPFLDRLLPPGTSTLGFVGVSSRRVLENREQLAHWPAARIPSVLELTLADARVGVLSQSATRRLNELLDEMIRLGWNGFVARCQGLAELDPTVYYLSRSAWDKTVTARTAHDDLFTTITGKQAVSDRLWLALGHIESATELTDQHDASFALPESGMLLKHYRPEPVPEWWTEQNQAYTQAMSELYRARDAAHPRSQPLLYFYAKRSEFVLEYLAAVKAMRQAAHAQQAGDREVQTAQLETAVESIYNAIDTLGDVAQDPSDRALIAMLNQYAYRPILSEYERQVGEP